MLVRRRGRGGRDSVRRGGRTGPKPGMGKSGSFEQIRPLWSISKALLQVCLLKAEFYVKTLEIKRACHSSTPYSLLSFQLLSPETQPASRPVFLLQILSPPISVRFCPFQPFLPDHPPEQGLHLRMQQDHPAPPPDRNDSRGLNPRSEEH